MRVFGADQRYGTEGTRIRSLVVRFEESRGRLSPGEKRRLRPGVTNIEYAISRAVASFETTEPAPAPDPTRRENLPKIHDAPDRVKHCMNFDEFTGEIQHRLELPDTGRTVRAIRSTLMTLGERLPEGQARDFAASLPIEIKWYMTGAVHEHGQRFDWQEFVSRVNEREGTGVDAPQAAYHSRVIVDLCADIVPRSDFEQLRNSLPESESKENWRKLFELVDSGGWSGAREGAAGEAQQLETGSDED